MVRRYRPGFDLRPPLPRRACPISFFPVDTGKTRMRRNPYHCPTLWILACGDVVFPAKAGNHVTPVRGALASSHHPLSDRRRLPQRGRPLPNLPPSGGEGTRGFGKGVPRHPGPQPSPRQQPLSFRQRLLRLSGESRKPRVPAAIALLRATKPVSKITQIKRITVQDHADTPVCVEWA